MPPPPTPTMPTNTHPPRRSPDPQKRRQNLIRRKRSPKMAPATARPNSPALCSGAACCALFRPWCALFHPCIRFPEERLSSAPSVSPRFANFSPSHAPSYRATAHPFLNRAFSIPNHGVISRLRSSKPCRMNTSKKTPRTPSSVMPLKTNYSTIYRKPAASRGNLIPCSERACYRERRRTA
jgi:hypothetical protein